MDSSFLTWTNIGLGLFSGILFLKMIVQFGLSNHPARFTCYVVALCATSFFCLKAATGLAWVSPWDWMKWRSLPMVAGSLALLMQTIMTVGKMSLVQKKVISRLPLIGGLVCLSFFPTRADAFYGAALIASCLFLTVSVGRARYQKRMILKMCLFILGFWLCKFANEYWVFIIGELMLFPALFYFFLFQQSFAITSLVQDLRQTDGEVK